MSEPTSHRVGRALGLVAGAGAACVAYGTFVERHWYRLGHQVLPGALRSGAGSSNGLRPGARGPLRILHLSDLHTQPGDGRLERFLERVAGEDYDLVALTGDLLGNTDVEQRCLDLLAPVFADGTPGVLVLGSNDVFGPTPKSPHPYLVDPEHRKHGEPLETKRLIDGLAEMGVTTLRGGTATIETRVGPVLAGGLDDPHLADTLLPELEAIAAPADSDAVLHLGLSHAPYRAALDLLAAGGHDVLLAGHTHGGQVRFPPFGAVVGNCDLPLDQVRGLSRYQPRPATTGDGRSVAGGEAWLHVSPGLGTSPWAPFRFACRPEATLLHLS